MIGIIEAVELAGQSSAQEALIANAEFNIFRGAIVGALIVGLAFLAGFAVLRRGALSYSAAFMVGTAALLELFWLGFFEVPNFNLVVMLQGVFAASVIIFLSASIRVARNNAALGGVMFAASLVFVGLGIINFLGRADFAVAMLRSLIGVGVFAFVLSAIQALRGDNGAQLILPGTVLTLAAVIVFATSGAGGLLGHGLFTLGILAASLVALTEKVGVRAAGGIVSDLQQPVLARQEGAHSATGEASFNAPHAAYNAKGANVQSGHSGRKPAISGERLLEVLDFSGIGVWDWSLDGVFQSRSLCSMLGADCEADFTPQAMRAFINPSHLAMFERDVLGHGSGDGGFDAVLRIHNDQVMRVRGARAVDSSGRLERVVAFFEPVSEDIVAPNGTSEVSAEEAASQASQDQHHLVEDQSSEGENASPFPNLHQHPQASNDVTDQAAIADVRLLFRPVASFGSGEIIGYRAQSDGEGAATVKLSPENAAVQFASAATFLATQHQESRQPEARKSVSSDAFVAIKASYRDLAEPGFLEAVQASMQSGDLPFGALLLELNGLDAIADPQEAKALFGQLRAAGARLAFADASADSAVLGNLHRYDFDYIRLQEDVVQNIDHDADASRNVRTLITLGRDLGLRVIASGIDGQAKAASMHDMGIAYGDGDGLQEVIEGALVTMASASDARQHAEELDLDDVADARLSEASTVQPEQSFTEASPEEEVRSLDSWMANSDKPEAEASDTQSDNAPDPLPSIRAAFTDSVPSFNTGTNSTLDADDVEHRKRSLPKWRTWGKQMR